MTRQVQPSHAKKGFVAAVMGTVVVALCCFTPLLVIGLGAIGLGVVTQYLDYVLLPVLLVMVVVTIVAYRRWRQSQTPPNRT
jgi:mercuric ion transport protein